MSSSTSAGPEGGNVPAKEGQEAMLLTPGRIVRRPQSHQKLHDYLAINEHLNLSNVVICQICQICSICINIHKFYLYAGVVTICNLFICRNM